MQGLRQRGQGEWGRGDATPFPGAKIFFHVKSVCTNF